MDTKKMGPSDMKALVEELKASGKFPELEEVLSAVADTREKYRDKILNARKLGDVNAKDGE